MIEQITECIECNAVNFMMGLLLLTIFYILSRLAHKIIVKLGKQVSSKKQFLFHLFASVAKTILIILGVITGLGSMGVNVSALVAGLGLTGFAVSFALKDSLSNLLSGILIIFYQPFEIGDTIEVSGLRGTVKKIDLRYTMLVAENKTILVPNTLVFTQTVIILNNEK